MMAQGKYKSLGFLVNHSFINSFIHFFSFCTFSYPQDFNISFVPFLVLYPLFIYSLFFILLSSLGTVCYVYPLCYETRSRFNRSILFDPVTFHRRRTNILFFILVISCFYLYPYYISVLFYIIIYSLFLPIISFNICILIFSNYLYSLVLGIEPPFELGFWFYVFIFILHLFSF